MAKIPKAQAHLKPHLAENPRAIAFAQPRKEVNARHTRRVQGANKHTTMLTVAG